MDPRDAVRLVRPRQWTKNLVVFAAIIFSGHLFEARPFAVTCVAFVSLCFVSSASYALNDVIEADRDRRHPVKRNRPVASGRISSRVAC